MAPNHAPGLLALDFDGVISDSAPESFVIALATYLEFETDTRYRDLATSVSIERAPSLPAIVRHPVYQAFIDAMPLGNRAEDFGVVLRATDAGVQLRDQRDYDRFRASIPSRWLSSFHARFYGIRTELADNDPAGWLALMAPYLSFVEMLKRRSKDTIVAIATAKDRRSVEKLLDRYGIADLFSPDRLLDKETGTSKDHHIRQLNRTFDTPFDRMVFIDDKLNHLEVVAKLGVRCGLAAWGYNGAREVESARRAGHPVFELRDVESALFG